MTNEINNYNNSFKIEKTKSGKTFYRGMIGNKMKVIIYAQNDIESETHCICCFSDIQEVFSENNITLNELVKSLITMNLEK